jgi:hypothetical protein
MAPRVVNDLAGPAATVGGAAVPERKDQIAVATTASPTAE